MFIYWLRDGGWLDLDVEWRQVYFRGLPWRALGRALLVAAPLIVFVVWRLSYFGMAFSRVEAEFFGRGFFSMGATYEAWREAFYSLFGDNPQTAVYYAVEFTAVILAFIACLTGLRKYPDLAWFGLLVVLLSFTSGPAQGMHRYVLAAPPLYLFLSNLGRRPAFDRLWSLASILTMGVMATMFMFDLWAG
jgi:hypothetical protein